MAFDLSKDYEGILIGLKEKIKKARLTAAIAVNNALLNVYWEIGDTINKQEELEGWGTKIVEKLAADLRAEFSDMKGLSPRNLRYMRDFALAYPQFVILQHSAAILQEAKNHEFAILQQAVAKLPWGHNCIILDKLKLIDEKYFYALKAVTNGWTRNMLVNQIESGLHKRQGALTNNFELALPSYDSELAFQLFKDPYHLDFIMLTEAAKERDLEDALMNHITKLLLELGDGFAFMGRQKKLEAGGKEFFIDLLFYNTKLRRHIVIELKIGEFEPEYVSKMNLYLGLADDLLKGEFDEPAIGLILCKTNNKIVAEYALRDTNKPIGIAEYKIAEMLPDDIKGELPSIQEIEQRMDEELKEQQNPVDARLKAIKDKLKNIQGDTIQTKLTYNKLNDLYLKGVRPLYLEIINRLQTFKEDFHSIAISWRCEKHFFQTIEEVDTFWADENNLQQINSFEMDCSLDGFIKGGTNHNSEYLSLKFDYKPYWYEFTLVNHNNQAPFLKGLYHQPISNANKQMIIDLLMNKVMDRIERIIENNGGKE